MTNKYKYAPSTVQANARYTTGLEPAMNSNPLIAALQPSWNDVMIANAMTWWPEYDGSFRLKPPNDRSDLVMRLLYSFETLPAYLPIIRGIMNAIRLGYLGRDRFVHAHTESIRAKSARMVGKRIAAPPKAKGMTFLIYGLPGLGKTWFLTRFSELIPQVIVHTKFRRKPWPCRQVTHLRVVVQRDWTDKALAQAIVEAFDRAAGTSYGSSKDLIANPTRYNYLMQFNLAAHNHGLGVLFVDEVQLMKNNQSLLTFILNFSTLVGVPLVMVGTQSSKAVMQADTQFMRRAEAPIETELKRFAFPEISRADYEKRLSDRAGARDEWTFFVEAFWHLQYTAVFTPLTHELSFLLHYYSAGLVDYALKLFVAAQLIRIGSKKDQLDKEALNAAYLQCFQISLPYIEALREGRLADLSKWEDFTGVSAENLAIDAAKMRVAAANRDEQSRLEAIRRQRLKKATNSASAPKVPDPINGSELPHAPKDK